MIDFTSRQLRAFLLAAQHHSFSRAAGALFITPSGLSVLIRELERNGPIPKPMETTLFNRLKPRSPTSWVVAVVLILVNIWYDYYHPTGIGFDIVVGFVVFIWYLKSTPSY